MIFCITIVKLGLIGAINRYYRVNIISSTSKPDKILPIYITVGRYLKP